MQRNGAQRGVCVAVLLLLAVSTWCLCTHAQSEAADVAAAAAAAGAVSSSSNSSSRISSTTNSRALLHRHRHARNEARSFTHSADLSNGAIREYWPEAHGFCGEFSVQTAAAYAGHWVSQRAARWLAGGEVLVSTREGENMRVLLDKLGLANEYWRKQPVAGGGLQRYLLWVKQQLLAGRVVVFPARIADGEDPEYDHLMPLYGIKASSSSQYSAHDVFVWTTGERREIQRAPADASFFAADAESCEHSLEDGGCISSSTPSYGAAVGGLPDRHGLYLPMRLRINSWEDGTRAYAEPRDGEVLGAYTLDLSPSGLNKGDTFTIFRFDMLRGQQVSKAVSSGSALANKPSLAALQQLCKAAGPADCRSWSSKVAGSAPPVLSNAAQHLGKLPANSVVFFIAVKGA